MFYKNILETVPIYAFGTFSLFSGLLIYDNVMYAAFNTFFTCVPIFYFAVFDFEYPKEVLARRPRLYHIGIEDLHFNKWVFWRWAFYGVWQSTFILFVAYYCLEYNSANSNGMFGGISIPSNLTFCMLVIVSNMKILISSYRINLWLVLLVVVSIALYFFVYIAQSRAAVSTN